MRRPVVPVTFFDDPMMAPPDAQGPEDEQVNIRLRALPYFEELPAGIPQDFHEELPADVSEGSSGDPGAWAR